MQLAHITIDNCPTCHAPTARDERDIAGTFGGKRELLQHVNGQYFESRTFVCGAQVEWVPNYEKLEWRLGCPEAPPLVEYRRHVQQLSAHLTEIVEHSSLSEGDRKRIIADIEFACRRVAGL